MAGNLLAFADRGMPAKVTILCQNRRTAGPASCFGVEFVELAGVNRTDQPVLPRRAAGTN